MSEYQHYQFAMCRFGVGGLVSVTVCQVGVFVLLVGVERGGVAGVGRCMRGPRLAWGGTPHSAPLS